MLLIDQNIKKKIKKKYLCRLNIFFTKKKKFKIEDFRTAKMSITSQKINKQWRIW